MGESNVTTTVGRAAMFTVFVEELYSLLFDMRWLFMLSAVLIIVDFWFGINKALKRKHEKEQKGLHLSDDDQIRASRALRRSFVKSVDYLGVVLVGSVLGQAIGEPFGVDHLTVAASLMIISCGCELDSIYSNYCECKGIRKRISIAKLLRGIFLSDKVKESLKEAEIKEDEK